MATDRSIKDKRYEEKHKEERKAKYMIWGTSVPRKYAEEINEFLAKYGFTKVQLIEAQKPICFHVHTSKDLTNFHLLKVLSPASDSEKIKGRKRSIPFPQSLICGFCLLTNKNFNAMTKL